MQGLDMTAIFQKMIGKFDNVVDYREYMVTKKKRLREDFYDWRDSVLSTVGVVYGMGAVREINEVLGIEEGELNYGEEKIISEQELIDIIDSLRHSRESSEELISDLEYCLNTVDFVNETLFYTTY